MHGHDDRRRKLAAARKRDYRHLIDAGGAVLRSVPVSDINGLVEMLVDLDWLELKKSEDKKEQAAALGAMVDDLVENWSK